VHMCLCIWCELLACLLACGRLRARTSRGMYARHVCRLSMWRVATCPCACLCLVCPHPHMYLKLNPTAPPPHHHLPPHALLCTHAPPTRVHACPPPPPTSTPQVICVWASLASYMCHAYMCMCMCCTTHPPTHPPTMLGVHAPCAWAVTLDGPRHMPTQPCATLYRAIGPH
jgi:hypothetical protein